MNVSRVVSVKITRHDQSELYVIHTDLVVDKSLFLKELCKLSRPYILLLDALLL